MSTPRVRVPYTKDTYMNLPKPPPGEIYVRKRYGKDWFLMDEKAFEGDFKQTGEYERFKG